MSTPITFGGFNGIDFTTVINALMTQASVPLTNLQTKQSNLQGQSTQYTTLASQLSTLQTAVDTLSTSSGISSFTTGSTDSTAATATATSNALPGHYDVVVKELARSQVTATASVAPDANSTVVASAGSLTIGGATVTLSGSVTLQGLADAINATSGVPATASVVQTDANKFRLVLTANAPGTANAFTITNTLTGGAGVSFTDTDSDGISGDSDADNAVSATNADVLVNNVEIISSSNTLTSAIPGASLTVSKKDPLTTVGIDIASDSSALRSNLSSFVAAYNNLVSFTNSQWQAAAGGDGTSIGRDPLVRSLSSSLRSTMTASYANSGALGYLAQLGVEFTQTGTMQINESVFSAAVAGGTGDAVKLLAGSDSAPGAFATLSATLAGYTGAGGLIPTSQQALATQISSVGTQISDMQARLNQQRTTLQQEFTAADLAMSQLQSQSSALTGVAQSLSPSTSSSSGN